MDLLKVLMESTGSDDLQKLGSQFGLDSSALDQVLAQVVPAMGRGVQNEAASGGGLDSLIGALQNGNHQDFLEDISAATSQSGVQEGNGILGHIFGNKDVSRNVAAKASASSGVSSDIIKQMLPVLATMAMGALSKQTDGGAKLKAGSDSGNPMDILGSLLDSNQDGSSVDDILNMAKKFF